tara:strand:+ start:1437 stop:1640 length:204 start_codon:yes stop_codon:yes gene_type:complete
VDDATVDGMFMDMIASNDWSELETENQPVFFDVHSQFIPLNMTILNLGYIPSFGFIDIVFRKETDGF